MTTQKKMTKIYVLILLMLLIISMSLSSCTIPKDILVDESQYSDEVRVLRALAVADETMVWNEGEHIYAYVSFGHLYKTDKKFSTYELVFRDLITVYNIIDGRIYFSYMDEPGKGVYSCNLDGNDKKKIIDDEVFALTKFNDDIYYSRLSLPDESSKDGFYRVDMATGKSKKINDDIPYRFLEDDGNLYYYDDWSDSYTKLLKYNLNKNVSEDALTWNNIIKFFPDNVVDDYIYYFNHTDSKMYRIRTDGSGKEAIFKMKNSEIGPRIRMHDGRAYYMDMEESIGTINLSTGEKKKLYDDYDICMTMNIIDDTIFFDCNNNNGYDRLCRMNLDGSNYVEIFNE